jgi:hypothetical protein
MTKPHPHRVRNLLPPSRYNHSGVTALRFDADWSGLVALDRAECVVEVEVWLGDIMRALVQSGELCDHMAWPGGWLTPRVRGCSGEGFVAGGGRSGGSGWSC